LEAKCLLCDSAIATVKKFNAQQHSALHEDNRYAKLEGEHRKIAQQKLKDGKQAKTIFPFCVTRE